MSNDNTILKNRTWNGKVLDKYSFTEMALNSDGHFEAMLKSYFKKHKLKIKITWEKNPILEGYNIKFQVSDDIMSETSDLLAEIMPYSYIIENITPPEKNSLVSYL